MHKPTEAQIKAAGCESILAEEFYKKGFLDGYLQGLRVANANNERNNRRAEPICRHEMGG